MRDFSARSAAARHGATVLWILGLIGSCLVGAVIGCGGPSAASGGQGGSSSGDIIPPAGDDGQLDENIDTNGVKRRILAEPDDETGEWSFNILGMPAEERATYQFVWDFGDGATAFGDIVYHAYADVGVYLVCVTASDPRERSVYVLSDSVVVGKPEEQVGGTLLVLLDAYMETDSGRNVLRASVRTSALLPGETVTYSWEFSDGVTAYGPEVTHVVDGADPFKVTVRAQTSQGRQGSYFRYFTVAAPPPGGGSGGGGGGSGGPGGDPPTITLAADAGPDQLVRAGATVWLHARRSTYQANQAASFTWTQTAGAQVVLQSSGALASSFTAPAPTGASDTITFVLTVTQGGVTDTDAANIVVLPPSDAANDPARPPPSQDQIVAWLAALKPLPKVHYGWPSHERLLLSESQYPLLYEYTRISHAVNLWYAGVPQSQVDRTVRVCKAVNETAPAIPATIAIVATPWWHQPWDTYRGTGFTTSYDETTGMTSFTLWGQSFSADVDLTLRDFLIDGGYHRILSYTLPNQIVVAGDETAHTSPRNWSIPYLPPTDVTSEKEPGFTWHDYEIEDFRDRLGTLRAELATACALHGVTISVSAIALDAESFRISDPRAVGNEQAWRAAMIAKYNASYNVAREVFPGAIIEWFERGRAEPNGYVNPMFTLEEQGEFFSCSLYRIMDPERCREVFRATYQNALVHGVARVHPWVALASGWQDSGAGRGTFFNGNWNYDVLHSWQAGAEVNNPWYSDQPDVYAPWNAAPAVFFWPRPFDGNAPYWGLHFVAYVRGAQGLTELP